MSAVRLFHSPSASPSPIHSIHVCLELRSDDECYQLVFPEDMYIYVMDSEKRIYTVEDLFCNGYHRILEEDEIEKWEDLLPSISGKWEWNSFDSHEAYKLKHFAPNVSILKKIAHFLIKFSRCVCEYVGNDLIDLLGFVSYSISFAKEKYLGKTQLQQVIVSKSSTSEDIISQLQNDVWTYYNNLLFF